MPNLYILDVKKGNSTVLLDTQGTVVIDAGKGRYLLEFLLEKQIQSIDILLLSHADEDHIDGVRRILEYGTIKIKQVFVNPDISKQTKAWHDLVYALDDHDKDESDKSILDIGLTTNLTGKLNQGMVHIEIIAPRPSFVSAGTNYLRQKATSNSLSAVIRLIYENKPIVLLTGDIDEIGFANILHKNSDIHAHLLVFPHHGGRAGKDIKAFTTQICNHVQPQYIVFSIGQNTDKFPLKEVIETISSVLPKTYMYTTNHSDIFSSHIQQQEMLHKNNVGHIHIDLAQFPTVPNFIQK